jgi:hypothetical protein
MGVIRSSNEEAVLDIGAKPPDDKELVTVEVVEAAPQGDAMLEQLKD